MTVHNLVLTLALLVGYTVDNFVMCDDNVPWEWDWQWTNNWASRPLNEQLIVDGKDKDGQKPECPADTLLQCWNCRKATSDKDCVAKGYWKTCLPGETCVFDKRWLSSQNTVSIRRGCKATSKCLNSRFLKPKCNLKRTIKWTAQCRVCGEGTWYRCRQGKCPGRYLCRKCDNVDDKKACERTNTFERCTMEDPVCEEKSVMRNGKMSYTSGCKSRLQCYNQPGLLPYCRETGKNNDERTCVQCSDIKTDKVWCMKCANVESKEACEKNGVYEDCDVDDSVCKETSGWNSITGDMYFSSGCIKKDTCPNVRMGDVSCSPVASAGVTECTACQTAPECSAPEPVKCRKCDKADKKRFCKELVECPETKGTLPVCKEVFGRDKDSGKLYFSSGCSTVDSCPKTENTRKSKCKKRALSGMLECTRCLYHKEREIISQ